MDYKGALLKGLKEIPSSSPKVKPNRTKPKIDLHFMSSSLINSQEPSNNPNWLEVPQELTLLIMQRVGWYDVLMNVKKVCKYWYMLSKDPLLWRIIEFRRDILTKKFYERKHTQTASMKNILGFPEYEYDPAGILEKSLHNMFMHVIDLSRGQLQDLCIQGFGSDNLFKYIYQRSSQLRRLQLVDCVLFFYHYNYHYQDISLKGMVKMLKNLPLLEELELPGISAKAIEIVGRHCTHLKSFVLNQEIRLYNGNPTGDKQALAVAKTMPGLRHLQLFGRRMTTIGLMAILNNCHHLEYLDLRQYYGLFKILKDKPHIKSKLRQQIKHVRFPEDPTEGYKSDDSTHESDEHEFENSSTYDSDDHICNLLDEEYINIFKGVDPK